MSDIPRKSVETLGFRVISQTLSVLTSVLLARTLGPYGKGIFAYITSVMYVLLTLSAGQSTAISWQYGRLRHPSSAIVGVMIRVFIFAGLPIALIFAAIALAIPSQRQLIAVAVAFPFAFLAQMGLGFFLADGNVRIANIQSLIVPVGLLLVLIPALLVFHFGLTAVLIAWVVSFCVAGVYSVFMLRPYAKGGGEITSELMRENVLFGTKVSANSLMALLNFRIDIFIILFVLGAKALGVYSIAIGFGELMWQLSRPLSFSIYGQITTRSKPEAANLIAKCVRHSLVMVTLACVLLFFIGPSLITLVYGAAFSGGGLVLRYLLPGIIAYSMMPFFMSFFNQSLGKPTIPLTITSVSAFLCAAITLATIRSLGIVSGAIATSISYSLAFLMGLVFFCRATGMPISVLFVPRLDDIRPYRDLLASIWKRAATLALGKRS